MTEAELVALRQYRPVTVHGGDYQYDGWFGCWFYKRSRVLRCVVEDSNGRLFIHRAEQIEAREE